MFERLLTRLAVVGLSNAAFFLADLALLVDPLLLANHVSVLIDIQGTLLNTGRPH